MIDNRHYPDAMAAGHIAETLSLKPNTASAYLTTLRRAGLIGQSRNGTSIHYRAEIDTIRALFGGLMAECCRDRPDLCMPGILPQIDNTTPDDTTPPTPHLTSGTHR